MNYSRTAYEYPQVWLLTLTFFCVVSSNDTIGFWIPTIASFTCSSALPAG